MPTYTIQSPDGRTVDVQGDSPPSESELQQIFSRVGAKTSQPYAGGDVKPGDYTPIDAAPQKGLVRRAVEFLAGGMVHPGLSLMGHQQQASEVALNRLGLMPPPKPLTMDLPSQLGGELTINPPSNGIDAARKIAGEGLQTALIASPGGIINRFGPTVGGAILGGGYGLGNATANADSLGGALADVGIGAAGGAVLGKAGQKIGDVWANRPSSLAELAQRVRDIPNRMSDYVMPGSKAAAISEDIQQGVSSVQRQMQSLREESGQIGVQKKQLQTQRALNQKNSSIELAKLEADWSAKVDAANKSLQDAIETKGVPEIKKQVMQMHKNMTKTYGDILDRATEGKTFAAGEYEAKVIDPLVSAMEADKVPETAPVVNRIRNLLKSADEEAASSVSDSASKLVDQFGRDMSAAATQAPPKELVLDARDFKHLNKRVTDLMSQAVKDGKMPPGMYDHWAIEFRKLQGRFLQDYAPELAQANKAYADMAFARKWLWKRTNPINEADMDAAVRMLRSIADGKPSATARAAIKLAEEGSGPIPGIGRGKIGQSISSEAQSVGNTQRQFETIKGQVLDRIAAEKDTLNNQITDLETRLRGIQSDRADIAKQNEAIRQMRERRTQLRKIAAKEKAIAALAAGYLVAKDSKVVHSALKMSSIGN